MRMTLQASSEVLSGIGREIRRIDLASLRPRFCRSGMSVVGW